MNNDILPTGSALVIGGASLNSRKQISPPYNQNCASTDFNIQRSNEGQDVYSTMMTEMSGMQKGLDKMNTQLRHASVRSHMLNVDVATMFSPETEEILRKSVEDCETCAKKVAALTTKKDI